MNRRTHRGDFADHVRYELQAKGEGAGSDEGSAQLQSQLARHIAERHQLLRMPTHAFHVRVAELVLRVDQAEHPLEQFGPELGKHVIEVHGRAARRVVEPQVTKEVLEELGVLHVHHSVGEYEHVVQRLLGIVEQLSEKLYERQNGEGKRGSIRQQRLSKADPDGVLLVVYTGTEYLSRAVC